MSGVLAPQSPQSLTKRKRECSDVEFKVAVRHYKTRETYVEHQDYWISDGNVLLQIGNVRFKLHKSRLANQSTWFQILFGQYTFEFEGPPDGFEGQENIDGATATAEVVHGLHLFYLNFNGGPSAEEFADLLTAMDNAINYIKQRPPYPFLQNVFKASSFYHLTAYTDATLQMIEALFPDIPAKITAHNSPHAIEALMLARAHKLSKVLWCTFYQLARTSSKIVPASETGAGAADTPDPLEGLAAKDLVLLLDLQKKLALRWDAIIPIAESTCAHQKCTEALRPNTVLALRKDHLFDPIFGINKLLKQNWGSKGFCEAEKEKVIANLEKERMSIWDDMKVWLNFKDE
ncbi:hypothetical protein BDZ97DRAFT_2074519 [Flammula alnicola]|nr:hypothetical protein BDZ97DRAFT_2074519 [Flammula alnicola]